MFLFTRGVVRIAASVITKLVDSIAPSITSVLVHGKQVSGHLKTGANFTVGSCMYLFFSRQMPISKPNRNVH